MSPDFSYEFDDLEILNGFVAHGEADFVLLKGKFEMTGLHIGWNAKSRLTITDSSCQIWQLVENALLAKQEELQDAYDKAEEAEREYLYELEADYKREERNLGF